VKLPKIFEAWGGMHSLHHLRVSTFAGAVIHDGNTRMKCVHERLRIRASLSVMQTQEHVNNANPVTRCSPLVNACQLPASYPGSPTGEWAEGKELFIFARAVPRPNTTFAEIPAYILKDIDSYPRMATC
jgi:hypothetical protein